MIAPLALHAEGVQVTQQQNAFGTDMVTITIGNEPQRHVVSRTAYRALVAQGVSARIVRTVPAVARAAATTTRAPVWVTGVYR